jgi:hypothetical protein
MPREEERISSLAPPIRSPISRIPLSLSRAPPPSRSVRGCSSSLCALAAPASHMADGPWKRLPLEGPGG